MLQNGDFRRLLTSNILLWQTLLMETVVLGWLVFERTNSPWLVSLVGFYRTAPFLVCGFISGPITDRFGRRKVMIAAQTANLAVCLALTILLWTGTLALWHLMFTAVILGISWALDWPARSALLPDLVGKALIVDATLLVNITQNLSRILGPATAGALIATVGPVGCYAAMTLLAGIGWINLYQLSHQPLTRTAMPASTSPWGLMTAGLRYAVANQVIFGVILITLVINLLYFPYLTLLPVFARDVLKQGPLALGLLGAATGIGAFLGLLLINLLRRRVSNGVIFMIGTFLMTLFLLLFALSTNYALSWGLLFLTGLGEACFVIMQSSLILLAASDEMRGRVLGLLMVAIGTDPLGKLLIGFLAERVGAPATIAIQSGVAGVAILIIAGGLPGLRGQAQAPAMGQAATVPLND